MERKTEVDRLKMEIEALRRALARLHSEFEAVFTEELERARRNYNPET
ncbi:MAG: hypothetical protein KGQ59_02825 [Bdellovibrionales bacterium]|nr:hypothetical protein [Bdellovibrionales bacterium]